MSRIALVTALMLCAMISFGQDISVTFTGTGAATRIDSVKATNLRTSQSVTLPGNQTLVLTVNTGISSVSDLADQRMVFPNPFLGRTTFISIVQQAQTVCLNVRNMVGQVVAQLSTVVQPGVNGFALSVSTAGIYLVNVTTDKGTDSYKIICTETNAPGNGIIYMGSGVDNRDMQNNGNRASQPGLKGSLNAYTLGYTTGDLILYRCKSGIYSTIVTDKPNASKNYDIYFEVCTDADGKNYPIVKIDDRIWMAENLAYLPTVDYPSSGKDTEPCYYVYEYNGNSVSPAKATFNYKTFGALYNWSAALTACPLGWHLPSFYEWNSLSEYLGYTAGGKLKETGVTHWMYPNEGATNESGFTAVPGGGRDTDSKFYYSGYSGYFWTSTETEDQGAWCLNLDANHDDLFWFNFYKSIGSSVRCVRGIVMATVNTSEITEIKETAATCGGKITSQGGGDITARGVCWSTSGNPTVSDSKTENGTGTGSFSSTMTGLKRNTNYYIRAYATTSAGTAYGEIRPFATKGEGDGTFEYEGRTYAYKKIGSLTWMKENLAYLPSVNAPTSGSQTIPRYYVFGYTGTSTDAAKASANYKTYGVLYNWAAARTACPRGWHLPSEAEWNTLIFYIAPDGPAGGKLKETGTSHWNSPNTGATDVAGFSALPAGYRNGGAGSFNGIGNMAGFWTSATANIDSLDVYRCELDYYSDYFLSGYEAVNFGFSVRCIMGNLPPIVKTNGITAITKASATCGGNITSDGGADITARGVCWSTSQNPTISDSKTSDGTGTGSFSSNMTGLNSNTSYFVRAYATNGEGTAYGEQIEFVTRAEADGTFDYGGRTYSYKTIGTQTWMTENLAWLPGVSPSTDGSETVPFYYVYGYEGTDLNAAKATINYDTYGVLYNWPAAATACPSGWHLPADWDWIILEKYLGMTDAEITRNGWRNSGNVGGKLKEIGNSNWLSPNAGATNSTGFTVRPGGNRDYLGGGFGGIGNAAFFWVSSESGTEYSWDRFFYSDNDGVYRNYNPRGYGFAVRCLKI